MTFIILLILVGVCGWFFYENKSLQNKLSDSKAENAALKTKKEGLEESLKKK